MSWCGQWRALSGSVSLKDFRWMPLLIMQTNLGSRNAFRIEKLLLLCGRYGRLTFTMDIQLILWTVSIGHSTRTMDHQLSVKVFHFGTHWVPSLHYGKLASPAVTSQWPGLLGWPRWPIEASKLGRLSVSKSFKNVFGRFIGTPQIAPDRLGVKINKKLNINQDAF